MAGLGSRTRCCVGRCVPWGHGDVLYLALEDNLRRLQSRIRKLWPAEDVRAEVPDRLHLATEWPRANEGGVAAIRDWIEQHPGARLVIVDVLAMFKATARGKDQTLYESDYQAIKELQSLAMETGVAIIVVHHTRKSAAETDPFEKVSGTLGLSGAADTTLILDRDQSGCTLYGRGRDIEEIETAVQFDKLTCQWCALGNASEVRRTDERAVILDLLTGNREAMSPTEIADALGLSRNNVKQLLFKMAKAGEVAKTGRGQYSHPDRAGYPDNPVTSDNFDNFDNHGIAPETESAGFPVTEVIAPSHSAPDNRSDPCDENDAENSPIAGTDHRHVRAWKDYEAQDDPFNPEAWR